MAEAFLLGGVAGMMATSIVQPLDLIKTRMQLASNLKGAATSGAPRSMFGTAAAVVRNEGFGGLYNGLSAALFRQATYSTTRFGVFNACMEFIRSQQRQQAQAGQVATTPFVAKIAAGMVSGGVAAVVGTPAEVALVRMTADGRLPLEQRRNYKNVFDALIRVTREEGLLTLWRGCGPTVSRAVLLNAAQLGTYSEAKEVLLKHGILRDGIACHLAASLASGLAATTVSLPADIAKTRIQDMKNGEYRNSLDCMLKIVRNEGFFKLWKGYPAFFARIGGHTVFTFIFLEQITALYKSAKLASQPARM